MADDKWCFLRLWQGPINVELQMTDSTEGFDRDMFSLLSGGWRGAFFVIQLFRFP